MPPAYAILASCGCTVGILAESRVSSLALARGLAAYVERGYVVERMEMKGIVGCGCKCAPPEMHGDATPRADDARGCAPNAMERLAPAQVGYFEATTKTKQIAEVEQALSVLSPAQRETLAHAVAHPVPTPKTCNATGCTFTVTTKGLCRRHYEQSLRQEHRKVADAEMCGCGNPKTHSGRCWYRRKYLEIGSKEKPPEKIEKKRSEAQREPGATTRRAQRGGGAGTAAAPVKPTSPARSDSPSPNGTGPRLAPPPPTPAPPAAEAKQPGSRVVEAAGGTVPAKRTGRVWGYGAKNPDDTVVRRAQAKKIPKTKRCAYEKNGTPACQEMLCHTNVTGLCRKHANGIKNKPWSKRHPPEGEHAQFRNPWDDPHYEPGITGNARALRHAVVQRRIDSYDTKVAAGEIVVGPGSSSATRRLEQHPIDTAIQNGDGSWTIHEAREKKDEE